VERGQNRSAVAAEAMARQAIWTEFLMRFLLFPVSLSKNICIGFSEFNELNEALNEWISDKKEVLLLANSRNLT
jgi:hypothetical protein